jgi:DNA polymerase
VHQRHVFIPKNAKFIIADYAQIEARIVNWLAGNYELLALIRGGMNIYEAHARMTMGWTGGKLKEEDPKTYALAKARVLMLGYGAGWEKFRDTAFKLMGLKLTDEDCVTVVEEFRRTNPMIVALWRNLGDALLEAAREDQGKNIFHLPLRSGRDLVYTNVHACQTPKKVTEWARDRDGKPTHKTSKSVIGWKITADSGGRKVDLYGGKLVENLVQATARDVFAEGIARLLDRGWHVPLHIHDEVVVDVPASVTVEEVVRELETIPNWAKECPIGVEAHEADHYCKE